MAEVPGVFESGTPARGADAIGREEVCGSAFGCCGMQVRCVPGGTDKLQLVRASV
ncbi:MAG: hypothetical protein AAGI37_00910 [Planctomycetota bacterium]